MSGQLTVVLVEKSFLIRAGVEKLLAELPGLVLRAVFDGTEKKLATKIRDAKPDLVLINTRLEDELLLELTQSLRQVPGLLLAGLLDENTPPRIAGRFPFQLRLSGDKYELLESLQKIVGSQGGKSPKDRQSLSSRELTILKKVALGLTNQQIADELFLSIHTVTTHRKNITKKLGIKTVSGLTVYALMNKLVDMHEVERARR